MVDSHCHLYFPEFDQDRDEVVKRARETGVSFFVQVGASLEGSRKAVELANQYDDMIASVGAHPHCADNAEIDAEIAELKKIALENKKVKAIGECGLDFGKTGEIDAKEKNAQIALFKAQVILAKELELPLIIHCRNAHDETIKILQITHCSLPVIIHCFTGAWEDAKRYLDIGCFISFSGIVSFKKAEAIQEAAQKVPSDRMLVETDAPYLAPEPNRGKRNEPAFIKNIIQSIADLRGASFEEIEKSADQNARKIFLPPHHNEFI